MIQFARPDTDLDRLGDEIAELAAHIHAAMYRLLACLREFDEREGWTGFRSCAQWLSWRTGIAPGAAREKVRVARALAQLPLLSDAMRRGEMSFAKARALTRIATRANEQQLYELTLHATAAHIETVVRAWRRCDRLEEREREQARHESRYLNVRIDEDGAYVVRGRLDPEVGAIFARALETAAAELRSRAPSQGEHSPFGEQQRADAVGLLAELALQHGDHQRDAGQIARAAHCQVVLHVDAEQAVLDDGVRVSAETSERLMCDASRVTMTHAANGDILDVGRRSRIVPTAIRRALEYRDRGCQFPGCGVRYCDAHHIRHWANGGATRLDNLVLLCRRHHRALHEEGYRMERSMDGTVRFETPNGVEIPIVPPLPQPATPIEQTHWAPALAIHPQSSTPDWHGEPLDIHFAIVTLRR